MTTYVMRVYWPIGQVCLADPGLMPLSCTEQHLALGEAEVIWSGLKDKLQPRPRGYLIYYQPSGKIVHETTVEVADLADQKPGKQKGSAGMSRLRFWERAPTAAPKGLA